MNGKGIQKFLAVLNQQKILGHVCGFSEQIQHKHPHMRTHDFGRLMTNQPQNVLKMFLNFYLVILSKTCCQRYIQHILGKEQKQLFCNLIILCIILYHKLTCFLIMTLFPFYKNMTQFSGRSCSHKSEALLAKFQPGVLNPFVLICGCLLYFTD